MPPQQLDLRVLEDAAAVQQWMDRVDPHGEDWLGWKPYSEAIPVAPATVHPKGEAKGKAKAGSKPREGGSDGGHGRHCRPLPIG
jgi:hypothetical protein